MKLTRMLVLLIMGLCGCQWIPGLNPTPPTTRPTSVALTVSQPPVTTTAPPATLRVPSATARSVPSGTAFPAGPLILASKDLTLSNVKPPYEIKIHYPEFAGATAAGLLAFNAEAKKQAQDLLAGFQEDFQQAQPLPDPNIAMGSFMETNYSITYGQHGLLSVLFTVGFYASGAAHPNSFAQVINFDLIHGKKLELAELFLPGSAYLKAVSDACSADLKQRERLYFAEGALPTADNYKNWNITAQGLQFSFDPYQVAAYAMGPSLVTLPYPSLKTLLKADGPLAVLLK